MPDGNEFVFEARNLVWFANTRKSEFDFISIPKEPDLSTIVWENFRRKVLQDEEIPYYGLLQDGDTINWPFVAIKHRDLNRQDITGHRVIIHDIILILPNLKDLNDKEAIKKAIPHNWFEQVWEASLGLDAVYAEVHSLWGDEANKRVKERLCKIQLQPSSEPPKNWKCVDDVISPSKLEEGGTKIPPPRGTETSSETGKKNLETSITSSSVFQVSSSAFQEGNDLDPVKIILSLTVATISGGVGLLTPPPMVGALFAVGGFVMIYKNYDRFFQKK